MKPNPLTMRHLIVAVLAVPLLAFCGKTIPVEELSQAKYELARAEAVNAAKYAPEKYEPAKNALLAAHEQVEKEKMDDAKKSAEDAIIKAREAFAIAAPQLAQDTRVEADKNISAADDAFAEEFAPTEFQNAKVAFAAGDDHYAKQQYVESFQKFEESREEANKALTTSEAQIEAMQRQVSEIEDQIRTAENYGADENAPDTIRKAREGVALAKQRIADKKLKQASIDIKNAKENADKAIAIASKDWARKKYVEAESAVLEADHSIINVRASAETPSGKKALESSTEAQDSLAAAEETLEAAKESLRNAEADYKDKEYNTSYNYSEEAIRLARIVKEQIPDAEASLAMAVKSQLEQNATDTGDSNQSVAGWKTYKVRLIPQRRDCLWRIAEYKFIYNNARLWPKIYRANKRQIKNPDLIYPGQVFDIPPKDSKAVTKPKIKKSDVSDQDNETIDNPDYSNEDNENTDSDYNEDNNIEDDNGAMEESEQPVTPVDEYEESDN